MSSIHASSTSYVKVNGELKKFKKSEQRNNKAFIFQANKNDYNDSYKVSETYIDKNKISIKKYKVSKKKPKLLLNLVKVTPKKKVAPKKKSASKKKAAPKKK